jgi:hypothetical protein
VNEVKEMIADLRGGFPEKCDFCEQARTPDELVPDEGGEWSCIHCWNRWESDDVLQRLVAWYDRLEKFHRLSLAESFGERAELVKERDEIVALARAILNSKQSSSDRSE